MSNSKDGSYASASGDGKKVWSDRKRWLCFPFSFTKYYIQDGRLFVSSGLFSSREDECLLYRITDISMTRSLGQKIWGTGTIHLNTKDRTTPVIHLENITRPAEVKHMLSDLIEQERRKHNVVGKEMYGAISHLDSAEMDADLDDYDDDFGGHH